MKEVWDFLLRLAAPHPNLDKWKKMHACMYGWMFYLFTCTCAHKSERVNEMVKKLNLVSTTTYQWNDGTCLILNNPDACPKQFIINTKTWII